MQMQKNIMKNPRPSYEDGLVVQLREAMYRTLSWYDFLFTCTVTGKVGYSLLLTPLGLQWTQVDLFRCPR